MKSDQPGNAIKILLVDDHHIVRQGIRQLLETDSGIEICGEAEDGEDAIVKALSFKPDIILMDVNLPKVNGYEATRSILTAWPSARIVILTYQDDTKIIHKFLALGVKGFFLKDVRIEILLESMHRIIDGETIALSPELSEKIEAETQAAASDVVSMLTEREKEVLVGLTKGFSNMQLAEMLTVSPKTVNNHLYSIYTKIGVSSRTEAILWALDHGISPK
jgi:DNA-binding NarL/FixJ family response regulator